MDDLTAFLSARLDEDEALANEIHRPRDCGSVDRDGEFDPDPVWCSCDYPARVLREVEAGRLLLRQFGLRGNSVRATVQPPTGGVWDDLLRMLALPYADHPDYRPEWKP
jgi:hypothetical protein